MISCSTIIAFIINYSYFRQRKSKSRERDHDKARRAGTSTAEKHDSKSPERKLEDVKPAIKSEEELKEEAAAAAVLAKVFSNQVLFIFDWEI